MMMSAARNRFFGSIRLNWKSRNESSVNIHLLDDEPPEIELSNYRRLPGSDSESPSELLSSEGLETEPIADLDLFFERLYNYYCKRGLWCIVIRWMFELLTIIFVLGCIWFLLLVVDWHALRNAKCGMEAIKSGKMPCNLTKEVINHHPLVPFTFSKGIIVGCMFILTIYGLFNFLKFFVQFKHTLKIHRFYYYSLNVTDREIGTSSWPTILEKVVQVQKEQQLCVVKDLSAHEIVMRIMRKENYLIGMLNKGILALPISRWVPGAGPPVNSRASDGKKRLILPKTLEWTLNWCIFQSMFDSKFCIQKDFLANPSLLRKRLVVVGILMFIISPCLVVFMLVYLFLRYAEQFYKHPRTAFSPRWSNLSKWIFREFNEVEHFFTHRLNNSLAHASYYLKQFPSPLISTIAKFISFVSGGFTAILIIIGFMDESLLEAQIFGRNLVWYAAVFGTVSAICRSLMTDELQVPDPEGAMDIVVQETHYSPKRWRGRENSDTVRAEFETLFQYTGMMLLEEMSSIFITPYLLIFVVPKCVDDVLRFISDFTVDVEGVGHVCSLSMFDFERHGNSNYASPFDAPKYGRSSQGKMEKSYLSFQIAYPTCSSTSHGRQFLEKLQNFRERQLGNEIEQRFSRTLARQINQTRQARRFLYRDALYNHGGLPISSYELTPDLRTLDWYYISQPHRVDAARISLPVTHEADFGLSHEQLRPYHQPPDGKEVEAEERHAGFNIHDQLQSNFEASTSSPFLRDDSYHFAAEHNVMDHWWTRSIPQSSAPMTSFLEPPAFNHHDFVHHCDDLSERSNDEQQEVSGGGGNVAGGRGNLRSLWRATCMNGSDEGFGLHFAEETENERSHKSVSEIFGIPLANLPVRIIPRSNDPVDQELLSIDWKK